MHMHFGGDWFALISLCHCVKSNS